MLWLVECSGWFKWLSWNYRRDLHAINHPPHQNTTSNINAKQILVLPNIWGTIIQRKIKTPNLPIFTCYSSLKQYWTGFLVFFSVLYNALRYLQSWSLYPLGSNMFKLNYFKQCQLYSRKKLQYCATHEKIKTLWGCDSTSQ